mgnify:FL=1
MIEEPATMVNDRANPQQASTTTSSTSNNLISDSNGVCLLVIDRRLDLVTPMVTPLTYAGLLDEIVSIDSGFIHVQERVINPPDDEGVNGNNHKNKDETKAPNNSSIPFDDDNEGEKSKENNKVNRNIVALGVHAGDTLFEEVRDQHVEKFGTFLQNQAIALKESHQNFTSKGTQKDLHEIHQFVKQIPVRVFLLFLCSLSVKDKNYSHSFLLICVSAIRNRSSHRTYDR